MRYIQLLRSLYQLVIFKLLLFFFLITRSHSAQLCTQEQSSALLQFVAQFQFGPSEYCDNSKVPYKLVSWKEGTDCCLWDGVECDNKTGQVIGIDLSCGGLHGPILRPNNTLFFHSFPHLQRLNLAFNYFNYSPIPFEVSGFTRLTHLNLSTSYFSDDVPIELSFLTQLVSLDLSDNGLLRLKEPDAFELLAQNLTKLRELNLGDVDLSSVNSMSFLVNLTSLTSLQMPSCSLEGTFPDGIFNLPYLESLDVGDNDALTGHFPRLFNSSSPLQYIYVPETHFSGALPESFGNLKSLKVFGAPYCNFYGPLPTTLGNLTQIIGLELRFNNFTGPLPPQVVGLRKLRVLDFGYNSFSGKIPSKIFALQALEYLDLSYNKFTGNITELGSVLLRNLTQLDVSNNNFTGPLPSQITGLPSLGWLMLDHNMINGIIPSWVFDLPSLQSLDLSYNKLTGHISEFRNSTGSLEYIELSHNNLHGSVPKSIFNMQKLQYLILSSNNFSGNVELDMLCQMRMSFLDMSSNRFSGALPPCLGNFEVLNLGKNSFSGTIPDTFAEGNLKTLNLNDNGFEGPIPESLVNCNSLEVLNLGSNNFADKFPHWLDSLPHLQVLILRSNRFEGPIPKSLVNCSSLEVLDLGSNNFTDKFPHWLDSLPHLQVLILRYNKFHGLIGTSKTDIPFPNLRVIDVSHNYFIGPLPKQYFQKFKAMMNINETAYELLYMGNTGGYYHNSLTMAVKGLTVEMEKVLTIFVAIDLSSNEFEGEIQEIVGMLNSIRGLNLSHNRLMGYIPASLGNLTKLEWLDLSSNKLTGKIPQQLTNLNFLAVLNLSDNQLIGSIPQGNQFNTFSNDSYIGSSGLCGPPLSNLCSNFMAPQPPLPTSVVQEEEENGFVWEVILPGYGCGLVFGLVIGYLMFSTDKPRWLVKKIIEHVEQIKIRNRLKNSSKSNRGRRN